VEYFFLDLYVRNMVYIRVKVKSYFHSSKGNGRELMKASWEICWNIGLIKSHNQSFCCSAGGGRIMAEEKLGSRINIKRVQMAAETQADILISNCPFCLTMFEDGVKGAELEDKLRPRDIAEILAERIEQ
jgi:Fe-S oxidoreductase